MGDRKALIGSKLAVRGLRRASPRVFHREVRWARTRAMTRSFKAGRRLDGGLIPHHPGDSVKLPPADRFLRGIICRDRKIPFLSAQLLDDSFNIRFLHDRMSVHLFRGREAVRLHHEADLLEAAVDLHLGTAQCIPRHGGDVLEAHTPRKSEGPGPPGPEPAASTGSPAAAGLAPGRLPPRPGCFGDLLLPALRFGLTPPAGHSPCGDDSGSHSGLPCTARGKIVSPARKRPRD